MIEANNKLANQKLEKLSAEMRSNSESVKLLSQKIKDLEDILTLNQGLIEVDEEMMKK